MNKYKNTDREMKKKNNCTGYQKSYDERSKLLAMFIKSYD